MSSVLSETLSSDELSTPTPSSAEGPADESVDGVAVDLQSLGETDEDDEDDDYEHSRGRRILENHLLLITLGIQPIISDRNVSSSSLPRRRTTTKRKIDSVKKPVFDCSGHIVSLPAHGEVQQMACVEICTNRKVPKIVEGEYQDSSRWVDGVTRACRCLSEEDGVIAEGRTEQVGAVDTGSAGAIRRKGVGLRRELRREMEKREGDVENVSRPRQSFDRGRWTYSPMHCHQCRRMSGKATMKCCNDDPICQLTFCETCCKRYSYFKFDLDSQFFICPRCRGCCNCSYCYRKRSLPHLLVPGETDSNARSLYQSAAEQGSEESTLEAWIKQVTEAQVAAPFDRIRLVDQATDVISSDLPDDEVIHVAEPRKKQRKAGSKSPKKRAMVDQSNGEVKRHTIRIKLPKAVEPSAPAKKAKEVDSDGDTVGGWSDEDDGRLDPPSIASTRTPITGSPSPGPARFAFPLRTTVMAQQQWTNGYLMPYSDPPFEDPYRVNSMDQTLPVPVDTDVQSSPSDEIPTPGLQMGSNGSSPTKTNHLLIPMYSPNGGGSRLRKPPPRGIFRAPKHFLPCPEAFPSVPESCPPEAILYRQLTLDRGSHPMSPLFQACNYENDMTYPSSINPPFYPVAMTPQYLVEPTVSAPESSYLHFDPPPYSHSPTSRPITLPASVNEEYLNSTWPQNLDVLSLAVAEAQQGPSS